MENNFYYATQKTYKTRTIEAHKIDQWDVFVEAMIDHCQPPRSPSPDNLPANIFAIFKDGGKRYPEDCEYITALVLDFDNKDGRLDSSRAIDLVVDYAFFAHHTKRTEMGRPTLRVILPLLNKVQADIWPQIYRKLIRQLGVPFQINSAAIIPSQAWLLPPGDCWYHYNPGKWLSLDSDNAYEDEVDQDYDYEMIQAEAENIDFKVKQLARLPSVIRNQKTKEVTKELGIGLRSLQREIKSAINQNRIAEAESNSFFNNDFDNQKDIEVRKDNLLITTQNVSKVMANDPRVFFRGKPIRMIYNDQRNMHEPQLMTSEDVVKVVHDNAQPYQWHIAPDGLREQRYITLPCRVGQFYLNSKDYGLRLLNGIATAPLLSDDGGIRAVEGYDPITKHWCENIPSIVLPDTPTREQADSSLLVIRKAVRTFAFADAEKVFDEKLSVDVVDLGRVPKV